MSRVQLTLEAAKKAAFVILGEGITTVMQHLQLRQIVSTVQPSLDTVLALLSI